jgi:ABC-type lipoprotein release transport system permease subunit
MPEEYVTTLAKSKVITVNHLLPSLTQKVKWPEQERTVLLIGIRGEVPFMHKDPKKPLIEPVPDGQMVMGYELHRSLNLKAGDTVKFLDREYKIQKVHEERGSVDDITIWMPLKEVQSILEMENRINAILALECNCATIDRLGEVRQEIAKILPETQVIEKGSKALARAEARNIAQATAAKQMKETRQAGHAQLEAQQQQRESLRRERESFAAVLVPLAVLVCAVWIGFLTFTNAKERTSEIGILRAIGISSTNILLVFLLKAFVVGFAGAVLASVLVMLAGASSEELKGAELGAVIVLAPAISCAAAWIPALMAAQQDPALVLREE